METVKRKRDPNYPPNLLPCGHCMEACEVDAIDFTTDGEALSRMADAAAVEGFRIVDLEIDPKGLVVSKA